MIDPMDRPTLREAELDAGGRLTCTGGRHELGRYPETCEACADDFEREVAWLEEHER